MIKIPETEPYQYDDIPYFEEVFMEQIEEEANEEDEEDYFDRIDTITANRLRAETFNSREREYAVSKPSFRKGNTPREFYDWLAAVSGLNDIMITTLAKGYKEGTFRKKTSKSETSKKIKKEVEKHPYMPKSVITHLDKGKFDVNKSDIARTVIWEKLHVKQEELAEKQKDLDRLIRWGAAVSANYELNVRPKKIEQEKDRHTTRLQTLKNRRDDGRLSEAKYNRLVAGEKRSHKASLSKAKKSIPKEDFHRYFTFDPTRYKEEIKLQEAIAGKTPTTPKAKKEVKEATKRLGELKALDKFSTIDKDIRQVAGLTQKDLERLDDLYGEKREGKQITVKVKIPYITKDGKKKFKTTTKDGKKKFKTKDQVRTIGRRDIGTLLEELGRKNVAYDLAQLEKGTKKPQDLIPHQRDLVKMGFTEEKAKEIQKYIKDVSKIPGEGDIREARTYKEIGEEAKQRDLIEYQEKVPVVKDDPESLTTYAEIREKT